MNSKKSIFSLNFSDRFFLSWFSSRTPNERSNTKFKQNLPWNFKEKLIEDMSVLRTNLKAQWCYHGNTNPDTSMGN